MISAASPILVISDSHGNVPFLTVVLKWACQVQIAQNEIIAAAIFLGDGADDLGLASARAGFSVPWHKVRGNGDPYHSSPGTLVLEIPCNQDHREGSATSSRKLFLTHGNLHSVNEGKQTLAATAKAAGAEAALFGHTHIPHCSLLDGIFLLNPGSIGRSRSNAGPTFALLECPTAGSLKARFFRLVNNGGKIDVEEIEI